MITKKRKKELDSIAHDVSFKVLEQEIKIRLENFSKQSPAFQDNLVACCVLGTLLVMNDYKKDNTHPKRRGKAL